MSKRGKLMAVIIAKEKAHLVAKYLWKLLKDCVIQESLDSVSGLKTGGRND